jgi:hypothetical protein
MSGPHRSYMMDWVDFMKKDGKFIIIIIIIITEFIVPKSTGSDQ